MNNQHNGAIINNPDSGLINNAPTTSRRSERARDSHKKKVAAGSACSLSRIAIKRKDNESLSTSSSEVILLNGNWDTSSKIPLIIAEMHNVSPEELASLKSTRGATPCGGTGLGGKQMKLNVVNSTMSATGSPKSDDSGIEGDGIDGNLSWLLNYKINELPPVPGNGIADSSHHLLDSNTLSEYEEMTGEVSRSHQQQNQQCAAPRKNTYQAIDKHGNLIDVAKESINFHQQVASFAAPGATNKDISSVQIKDTFETHQQNNYRYAGPKKPPFTYTELIEHALVEKGELAVSGIYQWISDHFPFYKQNDDRWKNSVRHNLSINPHFRKGSKAVHGAGHLWTIAQREDQKTWNIKKQRMQQFINTTMSEYSKQEQQEMELAAATASIMPSDADAQGLQQQQQQQNVVKKMEPQNVEVEYVIDMSGGLEDFLCPPVTKEQVVEECGLGENYLITDLNPNALGLNLADPEVVNSINQSNLMYDDLNFQCYELHAE